MGRLPVDQESNLTTRTTVTHLSDLIPGWQWVAVGAVVATALLLWVCVRAFAPKKNRAAWFVAALVLCLAACTFELMVLDALGSGEIRCLAKGCTTTYAWPGQAPLFWGIVAIVQGITSAFFALALYACGATLGVWRAAVRPGGP